MKWFFHSYEEQVNSIDNTVRRADYFPIPCNTAAGFMQLFMSVTTKANERHRIRAALFSSSSMYSTAVAKHLSGVLDFRMKGIHGCMLSSSRI